jgi:hypothetical protein
MDSVTVMLDYLNVCMYVCMYEEVTIKRAGSSASKMVQSETSRRSPYLQLYMWTESQVLDVFELEVQFEDLSGWLIRHKQYYGVHDIAVHADFLVSVLLQLISY